MACKKHKRKMYAKGKKNQFAVLIESPVTHGEFLIRSSNPLPTEKKAKTFMKDVVLPKFPAKMYKTRVKKLGLIDKLRLKKRGR